MVQKRPCTVAVRSGQQASVVEASAGWPMHKWQAAEHNGKDPKDVKFCIRPATQRPVVTLDISLPSGKTVKWECFANSVAHTEDDIGIQFWTGDAPETKKDLPRTKSVTTVDDQNPVDRLLRLANDNSLWLTRLSLSPSPLNANLRYHRPLVTGISDDELAQLQRKANPEPTEALVLKLLTGEIIDIYTEMWQSKAPTLVPFFDFTRTVFFAAASMGNDWFYRLAGIKKSVTDEDYDRDSVDPPRWLVTKWYIRFE